MLRLSKFKGEHVSARPKKNSGDSCLLGRAQTPNKPLARLKHTAGQSSTVETYLELGRKTPIVPR